MRSKKFIRFVLFFASFGLADFASATLMLSITDAGGGNTSWTFSGSDVIASGGPSSRNGFWFDEFNTSGFDMFSSVGCTNPVSGTFSGFSTTAGALGLSDVCLEGSRFGIRTSPSPLFTAGDSISWSGTLVLPSAIANFAPGVFTGNVIGTSSDFQTLTEGFVFSVAQDSPVPAPTTIALFGLGLAGLGFARRKKV